MSQLPKSILEHIADNCKWEASKAFSVTAMTDSHIEGTIKYIEQGYRCKSFDSNIWTQVFEFELERRDNQKRIGELKNLISEVNLRVSVCARDIETLTAKHAKAVEELSALEDELSQLTE